MTNASLCRPTEPGVPGPAVRPRFYLVSVGTSLFANYMKDTESGWDLVDIQYMGHTPAFTNHEAALSNKRNFPRYVEFWTGITKWISEISDPKVLLGISAEMSSLLRGGDTFREDDQVLLVATDTPEGHLCAHALGEVLGSACKSNSFGCPRVDLKCDLDGLGAADAPGFASRGLPSFIQYVQERIENKKKEGFEVVLVPTGGYKALIPYMVIAGVLEKIPNRYVYEESPHVLELPPLPLHVDLAAWMQIESILDLLNGADMSTCKSPVCQDFPRRVAGLMVADVDTGRLVPTGLGKVFHAHAREVAKPEVVLRAEHSPFLDFLSPCPELRSMFLKLAGIGHLIWKGDRVPEMADHGLRHHNDLFSLAERFLLPLFFHKDSFLPPQELYTLLCALFLHDCGHVVGHLDLNGARKFLLPTHVRDHHHVLAYLRLQNPNRHGGTGKVLHEALMPTGYDSDRLWRDYLAAAAVVGLYHRKKMPLTGDPYRFFGLEKSSPVPCCLRSLEEHLKESPLAVLDMPIGLERIRLIVCLLRIIDGLDEQVGRTGGPADVAFHLALLDTEVQEQEARAQTLRQVLKTVFDETAFEDIDRAVDCRLLDYITKEGKGYQDRELEERVAVCELLGPEEFDEQIKRVLSRKPEIGALAPLVHEYVHTRILTEFKRFQRVPYGEKVFIRRVTLKGEPLSTDGRVKITIGLEMLHDDETIGAYISAGCPGQIRGLDMKQASDRRSFGKAMLESMSGEYTDEVKTVLDAAGIELNYDKGAVL